MKQIYFLLSAALLSVPSLAIANEDIPTPPEKTEATLEDAIPDDILNEKTRFITLTIENDKFGNGTDEYYTHGTRLTYYDYSAKMPILSGLLDQIVPTFEITDKTGVYYSIGQNLYTPANLTQSNLIQDDRPYAGFLYGSAGFSTLSDNHIDDVEVTLGIVGPASLGEQTQKEVHKVTDSTHPKGWDNQLKNEPGLILSWERQWPSHLNTTIGPLNFRTIPHIGVSLGNVYTYASTGTTLQLTPKRYQWQAQPPRIRPAMPGSGFFAVPENRWAWSAFAGVEGRAIGRNIFLDGNSFTDSHSVDKKYFVADANAGVALMHGNTRITYTMNWRSKEFRNQEQDTVFGALSIGYRF